MMSDLYGVSFQYPDVEFRKNQDLIDLNPRTYYDNLTHQHSPGLMRYRSTPSSFLDTLVNGSNVDGGATGGTRDGEDYSFFRYSSPEIDIMLESYMSVSGNGSGSNPHDVQEFEGERPAAAIKQEVAEPSLDFQRSLQVENLSLIHGGNPLDMPFGVVGSEGSFQETKITSGNGSNLARQSSSPAVILSNLRVENGFPVIRDSGNYKSCNDTDAEASPQPSGLSNHLSFSSGPRFLPQMSETADENARATSPDSRSQNRKRQYDTWDDSSFHSLKRSRENDSQMFSVFNDLEDQNVNSTNRATGLTHHLSLPKTVAEMATVEKLLHFQSSIPCKIRAKRGCATHPRSIAERVRRTRISERMRKLQELFPDMDKQTNTADMLELAVEYIKDLQSQVKDLSDTKSRCKCSSTHKSCSSASA